MSNDTVLDRREQRDVEIWRAAPDFLRAMRDGTFGFGSDAVENELRRTGHIPPRVENNTPRL